MWHTMTTDQEPRGTAQASVTLEFTLERRDFADAVTAWYRSRRFGFFVRTGCAVPLFLACVALTGLRIALDGPGSLDVAAWALPLAPVLLLLMPWLSSGAHAKANAHHGRLRATVDGAGIRLRGARVENVSEWPNFGGYIETRNAFLLRSPEKAGRQMVILPKRGLADEADTSRLRALLDAHLRQAG